MERGEEGEREDGGLGEGGGGRVERGRQGGEGKRERGQEVGGKKGGGLREGKMGGGGQGKVRTREGKREREWEGEGRGGKEGHRD